MPQGKGTYGSQVGRPSKKKYDKGGNVDPFSLRNPEGVPVKQLTEIVENQNMANEGLPTNNAQERSQVSPDVTSYKEGGFIKKAVGKYKREKARKKAVEDFPITGIVQPKKKGLKPAVVSSNPPLIPHYGAKGRSSIENLITDSVYGTGASKKRYGNKKGKKK